MTRQATHQINPALPDDSREAGGAARGAGSRALPYALIALVTFYCHGFILTNDGPIWDGWYWVDWLRNRNWAAMREYTSAQALPYTLWAFAPFAFVSEIIPVGMCASFLCLLADGILFYELARRLAGLPRHEALAVALLAQALPLFSAAQDMPVFGLIVFRTLFYGGVLLATLAMDRRGVSHWVLRLAALAAFYFSCVTNGALLVYYGGFYLLLLIRYRRIHGLDLPGAVGKFLVRYPDFFVAPPAILAARLIFIPQFGWYAHYNTPGDNLDRIGEGLWSFVANVLPFHATNTGAWFIQHPILTVLLLAGIALWWWKAPLHWSVKRSEGPAHHFVWFGCVLLFFAVFPLAAAGKIFDPRPVGEPSRHCMLAGLPLAILLFAVLRTALFWRRSSSRLFAPVVASVLVIFGSQYLPSYLSERVEWIVSRSMLHNAVRSPIVRDCSVIASGDCSVFRQVIYGIHGVATAFGERTRYVAPFAPGNGRSFQPSEIEWYTYSTTVLPGEYRRIDPGGRQIHLGTERHRGQLTDWEIARRYLAIRWFGSAREMDDFLASFTTSKIFVFKEATPLVMTPAAADPSLDLLPAGTFHNRIGMILVQMPWRTWVAQGETTQGHYEQVMGGNPSIFRDPLRPVDGVSWDEAAEFCRRLTALEAGAGRLPAGHIYRLPTVAEFDRFVARAGIRHAVLNEGAIKWSTFRTGSRPADEFGLHDVLGNVWEWCLDWGDEERRMRISKGGSFSSGIEDLIPHSARIDPSRWLEAASKARLLGPVRRDYPDQGYWNRGFRVVLAAPVPEPTDASR